MKIASVENENGVSSLLNSHFDKHEVVIHKFEQMEDLIDLDLDSYDLILVDMTYNKCLQVIQYIRPYYL